MRRSIRDYINKKTEEIKAHYEYDINFCIKPTSFKTNNREQDYEVMVYEKDITEDGTPIYNSNSIKTVSFKRNKYITATNDLFDVIKDLPRASYKIFKYIIDNIDYNYNHIKLSTEDIKRIIGTKYQSAASKAIGDLIKSNIICKCPDKTEKDIYCINHNKYFKGNFTNFIIKYNKIYGVVNGECNIREDVDD